MERWAAREHSGFGCVNTNTDEQLGLSRWPNLLVSATGATPAIIRSTQSLRWGLIDGRHGGPRRQFSLPRSLSTLQSWRRGGFLRGIGLGIWQGEVRLDFLDMTREAAPDLSYIPGIRSRHEATRNPRWLLSPRRSRSAWGRRTRWQHGPTSQSGAVPCVQLKQNGWRGAPMFQC
jgi:hypothetical protein